MSILKNKITLKAIFFTLCVFVVYRIGFFIITPLINGDVLTNSPLAGGTASTLFDFIGGGNLKNFSIFALGVSPYITASIVIQLLENDLIPSIAEWKHQGVDGQNKRYAYTKYLAIIFAFIQAAGLIFGFYILEAANVFNAITFTSTSQIGILEYLVISLFVTAGTTILIWLADRITEKGIGNGMSVIIMAGIIARMPEQINQIYSAIVSSAYNGVQGLDLQFYTTFSEWFLIGIIGLLLIIVVIIYTLAYRKVNINYVKNSKGRASKSSYLPIKLNPAGVIPIIFVVPIMQLPLLILKIPVFSANGQGTYETAFRAFFDLQGSSNPYWIVALIVYVILIVIFSVMYSYIQLNPENMAENLEKQSAYVIGVRPGKDTENYLTKVITRTTIYGALVLSLLAATPILLTNALSLSVGLQLIGTGLIITVNVLVQTYQSLDNKANAKTYKTLFAN